MTSIKKLGTIDIAEIYEGAPINNPYDLPHPYQGSFAAYQAGFAWKEIGPTIVNDCPIQPDIVSINRMSDACYSICYIEDPLSQLIERPSNAVNRKIMEYLSDSLGDLWNMDAIPFSRIVSSYLTSPVWTHYLDWAYNWMKKGRDLEVLELILEYRFESKEIELLKLPSHNALQYDGWKVTPIIDCNGNGYDSANFTKEEPFLIVAAPYTQVELVPRMMKRFGPNKIATDNIPRIFYSSVLIRSKMVLPEDKRMIAVKNNWKSSFLDEIFTMNGIICSKGWNQVDCRYEPELEDCQLCDNASAICSICGFRDLLFCHVHSRALARPTTPAPSRGIKCRKCHRV